MQKFESKVLWKDAVGRLEGSLGDQEAQNVAFYLLNDLLSVTRIDVMTNAVVAFDDHQMSQYDDYILRLNQHEPIQYIFGQTEFYGRQYCVDAHVLIPRPETEELVKLIADDHGQSSPKILDIGTGSGCIACTLALEILSSHVLAIDVSTDALAIAKENARRLGAEVAFEALNVLTQDFTYDNLDIIVSNPPYVMEVEKSLMSSNVLDHEPSLALFVKDNDPLIFYRTILAKGKTSLRKGGKVYFEINEQFGLDTQNLCTEMGYVDSRIYRDINGKNRFVTCVYD